MADRFFDELGASDIRRDLCGVTAWLGAAEVTGTPFGLEPEQLRHSKTILLWGTNTRLTNRHLWPSIEEAKANGATVIVIDPIKTATATHKDVDVFLHVKPGSDVALVLAMIHVMDTEGLLDPTWLAESTEGSEDLLSDARAMPPSRADTITGIPQDQIRWLARTFATQSPSAIRVLVGPEHREHGQDIMRAIAMLPAVTGAWRHVGGGLARSTQAYFEECLNINQNRRTDRRLFNMASLGQVLNDASLAAPTMDTPIEALIVHNSNPAVICPDQNEVVRGLEGDDLFCVVLEQFMTDTARYADIVLPATTQLEHLDLMISWGHFYLALNQPAIAAVGGTLPNTEIFRRLAAAMAERGSTEPGVGFDDPQFADSDEDLIRQLLDSDHEWLEGISFDGLVKDSWARLNVPENFRPYVDSPMHAPDGRFKLGSLQYKPGRETPEGNPELAVRFPLNLISRKQHIKFLNANYGGFPEHQPAQMEPFLELDAADAASRDIQTGDLVEVFNDRGSLTLRALVSDEVQPGLTAMPFGWWHRNDSTSDRTDKRGVNALTSPIVGTGDAATSPGRSGSAAFHENLVQVRKALQQ